MFEQVSCFCFKLTLRLQRYHTNRATRHFRPRAQPTCPYADGQSFCLSRKPPIGTATKAILPIVPIQGRQINALKRMRLHYFTASCQHERGSPPSNTLVGPFVRQLPGKRFSFSQFSPPFAPCPILVLIFRFVELQPGFVNRAAVATNGKNGGNTNWGLSLISGAR